MLATINRGAAYGLSTIIGFIGAIAFFGAGPIGFVFFLVGPWLAILMHELGHAIAAAATGMNVRFIVAGPIQLSLAPLRVGLASQVLGHDVGGYVLYDERPGRYLTRQTDILITAAGPLANLSLAIAAYVLGRFLLEGPLAHILIGLAFASLAAFVISAWPFQMHSGRANDALEIVRAVRSAMPRRRTAFGKPKRSPWQAP
jgi:membrane-associated protease RseP (regulator of RpoE activity)